MFEDKCSENGEYEPSKRQFYQYRQRHGSTELFYDGESQTMSRFKAKQLS